MLLRVDDSVVLKSDRYCFIVCHDKGITRFPGGVEGNYYKPVRYCGLFHEIKISLDKEDANISTDLLELMRLEYEMWSCLSKFKRDIDKYNICKSEIKFDKDCFINKYSSCRTYHNKLGVALYMAWVHHFREGLYGQTEFCTVQDVLESMKIFKDKLSSDLGVEFHINGEYPSYLM